MRRKFLKILSTDRLSPYVIRRIDDDNMLYGYWIGLLCAAMELVMIIWSFFPGFTPDIYTNAQEAAWLFGHRLAYLVLLIASAQLAFFSHKYLKSEQPSHILSQSTTLTFAVVGLMFALYVSTMEYVAGGSMVTLSVHAVVIFSGLLMPPAAAVVMSAGTFSILIFALDATPRGTEGLLRVSIAMLAAAFALLAITKWYLRVRGAEAEESRNELVDKFRKLSLIDELTGLGNRYAFREEYSNFLYEQIVMLLCNIDDFHRFNEVYGREKADDLLVGFAEILQEQYGSNVYRFTPDEFLVITSLPPDEARQRAALAVVAFRDLMPGEKEFIPTFTGAYIYGKATDEEMQRRMLRATEDKLHVAKSMGKNRVIGESYMDFVSEQDRNAERIRQSGDDIDPLTGLWSMEGFLKLAEQRIEVRGERNETDHFIYFNTENFKIFNEEYGYREGNAFLKSVARILLKAFPNDIVSRFADDRFVVLASGEDIRESLEEIYRSVYGYNDKTPMTIRAGIYDYDGSVEASVACDRAKLACDSIKKRYDIHYTFYDESIRNRSILQQHILNTFEEALKDGRIRVCFQPIVRTLNNEVCGVEALTRWEDPDYGMISPADFIETLEEFHLINQLDTFVVGKICENYSYLVENGYPLLAFSVNLSRLDFELCDIVMEVKTTLEKYHMPVNMLHIEVTENAFAGDQEFLRQEVTRFKAEGFEIWMDDFGSGYSSLNVLRYYPFDVIKLDMKFLEDFQDSAKSRTMLAYMVSLAKEYGIQTLAEGIETADQYEYLRRIGCEMVQGYYLGVPHALVESASYLAKFAARIEDVDSKDYYEACGRVNILRPGTVELGADMSILASEQPLAILELKDEHLRLFSFNDQFAEHLKELGLEDVKDYETLLLDHSNSSAKEFRAAMRASLEGGEWQSFEMSDHGEYYSAWIRHFANDEKSGANAFMMIVVNQTRIAGVFHGKQYVAQGKRTVFRVL